MLTLLSTMILVTVSAVLLTVGFLYRQDDPQYKDLKFYQILGKDLGVRIPLWLTGGVIVAYAVYGQFM